MAVVMGRPVVLVVIDIAVVAGLSIGLGATAPRWPARWFNRDRFPLHLWSWESARFYRRAGTNWLAKRLPELGAAFGGQSKSVLPGHSPVELQTYLVEVRRAEWVHWLSVATCFALFAFNPWWLALVFLVGVFLGNVPFILILRNNRRRLLAIVERASHSSEGRHP
jgi:hypothetical protein